jgi:hypothetical protein
MDKCMKKSKFGIATKTLLAFSAVLVVLTFSLTTATMAPLSEGFEASGKISYSAVNVTLGTGSWYMDDALTGNLSTDRKTGAYSARVRNTGLLHMNFNIQIGDFSSPTPTPTPTPSEHLTMGNPSNAVTSMLPVGSNDVSRVTTSTRTIAVVIPNSGSIGSDWRAYRVSVDQVEAITGFDFFSNVPSAIQNVIEGRVDNQ